MAVFAVFPLPLVLDEETLAPSDDWLAVLFFVVQIFVVLELVENTALGTSSSSTLRSLFGAVITIVLGTEKEVEVESGASVGVLFVGQLVETLCEVPPAFSLLLSLPGALLMVVVVVVLFAGVSLGVSFRRRRVQPSTRKLSSIQRFFTVKKRPKNIT